MIQIFFIFIVAILAACASGPNAQPVPSATQNSPRSDQVENWVDEGEKLFEPSSFLLAREKFRQALDQDSKHERARFWLAVTDFFLEFKGIVARIKPAYLRSEDGASRYARLVMAIDRAYPPPYAKYLKQGQVDVVTSKELSEWLKRVSLRVDQLRQTIRELREREAEFSIHAPTGFLSKNAGDCASTSFGPIKFRPAGDFCLTGPANTESLVGLNRADFDELLNYASYFKVFLDVWNAYRANPEALITLFGKSIRTKAEADAFMSQLLSDGANGALTNPQALSSLPEIASDYYQALRYQANNQRELCPYGSSTIQNRRGYLFAHGSCIRVSFGPQREDRELETFEVLATGQSLYDEDGDQYDVLGMANDLPRNLKDFFPLNISRCGVLTGFNVTHFGKYMTPNAIKKKQAVVPCPEPYP